jgi:hypothetical protein
VVLYIITRSLISHASFYLYYSSAADNNLMRKRWNGRQGYSSGCWYHNNTWGYVLSYICDCIVYTHFRIIFIEEEKRAETGRARRPGVVMVADWQFAPRSIGWWSKQKEFSPFSIMYTFPTNGSEHTDIENNNNNNNKRNMTHALKVIYLGYQYV